MEHRRRPLSVLVLVLGGWIDQWVLLLLLLVVKAIEISLARLRILRLLGHHHHRSLDVDGGWWWFFRIAFFCSITVTEHTPFL